MELIMYYIVFLEAMKQFEEKEEEKPQEEKIEPSHSLGWMPKRGENYYYIYVNNIYYTYNDNCSNDNERFAEGNCFKTEAEAKKVINKRQALRRIHEYIRENNLFFDDVDWYDYSQYKWTISGWNYYYNRVEIRFGGHMNVAKSNLIFRTGEDRQKVLNNCAEDLKIFLKD